MGRRSRLRNAVEYGLAVLVLKSLEWAPLALAHGMARGYARLLDLAVPRLRQVALQNLSMALPELSEARRSAIADGVFDSIARMLVTFAKFPAIARDPLDRWVRVEGYEHVKQALQAGKGVLFATAHLGNWELSAFVHARFAAPMHVVARPLDNPYLDRLVERRRGLSGNRVILKQDSARAILKALAANEAVGVLIDQNAALESGVFVDFFGIPASANPGFAKLAAHSGAAVIPGFALWSSEERRYVLRFDAPVPISGDAARDTQALQARVEAAIRQYPDQWLWIHRRWKTRPPGAPPLYQAEPQKAGAGRR